MLDVRRASVRATSSGVVIDDPECFFTVTVDLDGTKLREIVIRDRNNGRITGRRLGKLPLQQIIHVAAAASATEATDAGETHYRMLATPKPPGVRSWPPAHYRAVLTVAEWAFHVKRDQLDTIAEFWSVSRRTAARWVSVARSSRTQPSQPSDQLQRRE